MSDLLYTIMLIGVFVAIALVLRLLEGWSGAARAHRPTDRDRRW
ncbi:hypothetical protein [Amycolatopsis anabasis]|nr:hypothetical protein [Amycolatopsis anabasis]